MPLRMVEVQTTQQRDLRDAIDAHDRHMAELQAQAEAKSQKLDEKYRTLKEQIRSRHETSWRSMAETWREGMRRAAAEVEAVRREAAGYCPRLGRPGLGDRGRSRALVPPVLRFGEIPLDLGHAAGRRLARRPADGGHPHAVRRSPPSRRSPPPPTC